MSDPHPESFEIEIDREGLRQYLEAKAEREIGIPSALAAGFFSFLFIFLFLQVRDITEGAKVPLISLLGSAIIIVGVPIASYQW